MGLWNEWRKADARVDGLAAGLVFASSRSYDNITKKDVDGLLFYSEACLPGRPAGFKEPLTRPSERPAILLPSYRLLYP